VEEVFELDPDLIEPAPRVGSHLKTEFIRGMGKRDDSFIIILDAEKMLSSEELSVATVPMAETSSEARAANE